MGLDCRVFRFQTGFLTSGSLKFDFLLLSLAFATDQAEHRPATDPDPAENEQAHA